MSEEQEGLDKLKALLRTIKQEDDGRITMEIESPFAPGDVIYFAQSE